MDTNRGYGDYPYTSYNQGEEVQKKGSTDFLTRSTDEVSVAACTRLANYAYNRGIAATARTDRIDCQSASFPHGKRKPPV